MHANEAALLQRIQAGEAERHHLLQQIDEGNNALANMRHRLMGVPERRNMYACMYASCGVMSHIPLGGTRWLVKRRRCGEAPRDLLWGYVSGEIVAKSMAVVAGTTDSIQNATTKKNRKAQEASSNQVVPMSCSLGAGVY